MAFLRRQVDMMNGRLWLGGVLSVISFLLLTLTLVLPWYHIVNNGYTGSGVLYEHSFYLMDWEYTNVLGNSDRHSYDDIGWWEPVSDVMFTEMVFIFTSMAFVFVSVAFTIMRKPKSALGSGIVAFALLVSAAAYFFISIPDALNASEAAMIDYSGFTGQSESSLMGYDTWGPLIGWYMLLGGVISELAALILTDIGHKGY